MKKILISLFVIASLFSAYTVFAQVVITLKEKPVTLIKQGDVYTIQDTSATAAYNYFTYTDSGTNYVCTTTIPTELGGVTYTNLNVRVGTTTSNVNCYPSTYFVIP